jgi:hypothetical protein
MKTYRLAREVKGLYSVPALVDRHGDSPLVARDEDTWVVTDSRGKVMSRFWTLASCRDMVAEYAASGDFTPRH